MLPNDSAITSFRMKRNSVKESENEMTGIKTKTGFCKNFEFGSKVSGLLADVMGDMPDPRKSGALLAVISHIGQAGINVTSTALECDDSKFEDIKILMKKRFNTIDKKFEIHAEALEDVSHKVSDLLYKFDSYQMFRGQKIVTSEVIGNKEIKSIINNINIFNKYYEEAREELNGYGKDEYFEELSKEKSILNTLENYSDSRNSLYSALYELIDRSDNYAIPDDATDDNAFLVLYALFHGTQTYFAVKVLLIKQRAYLANYYYELGDFEGFNTQLRAIKSLTTKFKDSLFTDVISIINQVKNKSFINDVKNEWYRGISDTILLDLKESVEEIDLNMIDHDKEIVEVKSINFSQSDITSKYGDWKDKSTVSYAVQLRNKNKYSKFSRWSEAEEIGDKANPMITVPQDKQGRERLIFRKFDKGSIQFVGVLMGLETSFRDINRDLYNAVGRGDQDLAYNQTKLLIENGANITALFEHKRNMIHAASSAGNDRVAADFLFGELDVNSKDKMGYTPLHLAAESNQKVFIRELIKQNANVNVQAGVEKLTPLHVAAKNGYLESVKELMKSKDLSIDAVDKNGFTALHHAIHKKDNSRILHALMSNTDINVNIKTKLGLAPLHLAAINGFSKVIDALVTSTKLENINETNDDGANALHFAAMAGNYFAVKKLLSMDNIGINQVTFKNKLTPLHFAIYFKNGNVASQLLKDPRIDINLVGRGNITHLHLAVASGDLQTTSILLSKGADKEAKIEDSGYTAVHLAMLRSKPDALLFLINNNANLNAQSNDGSTALHLACKHRKMEFLDVLLEANVDAKLTDKNGYLAIQISIENMDLNFVRAIVEKNLNIVDEETKEGRYVKALAHEKSFRVMYHYLKNRDSPEYDKYYGLEPVEVFRKLGVHDLFDIILNPSNDPEQNREESVRYIYENIVLPCMKKEKKGTPCELGNPMNSRLERSIELHDTNLFPKFSANFLPEKGFASHSLESSSNKNSFSSSASNVLQNANANSVLLLIDLLVRKFANKKHTSPARREISSSDSRAKVLILIEKFEKLIDSMSPSPAKELINLSEVSSKVYKALENENYSQIEDILRFYIKEFLKPDEVSALISKLNLDEFFDASFSIVFILQSLQKLDLCVKVHVEEMAAALSVTKRDEDSEYEEGMQEIEDRKQTCKALEYAGHVTGLVTDLIDDIPEIPFVTDTMKKAASGIAMAAHIAQFGMNIQATTLECDDVNTDEIKLIMDKRFNEVDRKLDRMTEALEEVSRKVSETLLLVDRTREEMNKGFQNILATLKNMDIEGVVNRIYSFSRYFEEKRDELSSLDKEGYIFRLTEKGGVLDYLKKIRTPEGLHSDLLKLMDETYNYAIPEDAGDAKSFQALYALIYGIQTYGSVMFFLLQKHTYLADYYYQRGDTTAFNNQIEILKTTLREFQTSLTGKGPLRSYTEIQFSLEPTSLIQKVEAILRRVKNKPFYSDAKLSSFKEIESQLDALFELKSKIRSMELSIIFDTPKGISDYEFKKPIIKSEYGVWDNKAKVRYAVQLRGNGSYSKFSEWSEPLKVEGKANPTLIVPEDQQGRERLVYRKVNDDTPQLIGILDKNVIEFRDIDRDLYNAAKRKDQSLAMKEIDMLLSKNANVSAVFDLGRTLLHSAAESGNVLVALRFLIDTVVSDNGNGTNEAPLTVKPGPINVDAKDQKGYTPMHVAAETRNSGFISLLITHGAKVNEQTFSDKLTPLHIAAREGHFKAVRNLIKDEAIEINKPEKSGYTPLHFAVNGGVKVINQLLTHKDILVDAKSENGFTPFQLAVMKGDRYAADALIKSGKVDINAGNEDNMTPLHMAAMSGNDDMVNFLLSQTSIDVNALSTSASWTPLYSAVYFKKKGVAFELVTKSEVHIASRDSGTPLHASIATGQVKVFEKLLEKQANIEAQTNEGLRPLHLAAMQANPEFLSKLIHMNADINVVSHDGSTPLHLASNSANLSKWSFY
nr:delta-latroinsectotoxin-Lt1a-like [Parasteatoda tepidariorum]